jgi:hypothetical protein
LRRDVLKCHQNSWSTIISIYKCLASERLINKLFNPQYIEEKTFNGFQSYIKSINPRGIGHFLSALKHDKTIRMSILMGLFRLDGMNETMKYLKNKTLQTLFAQKE